MYGNKLRVDQSGRVSSKGRTGCWPLAVVCLDHRMGVGVRTLDAPVGVPYEVCSMPDLFEVCLVLRSRKVLRAIEVV